MTENVDPDKYVLVMILDLMCVEVFYYEMVVGLAKNTIIFGADMSSAVHIDKRKDILILGKDPADRLYDTTLTGEEKDISKILLSKKRNFVWVCIIMGWIIINVNGVEIYKFKAKNSEINAASSRHFSVDNVKKIQLSGCVCDCCLL